MKRINYLFVTLATLSLAIACNNVNYKKAKSGMLYKIFSSDSKDSVAKPGDWVKLNFTVKLNDSVLQTTYGKMPFYTKASLSPETAYNPTELLVLVKKGDSVVCVALADTLFKRGQLPEGKNYKKGDRLITTFKVLSVFRNDSTYMADEKIEFEKDKPRAMKEQQEQMKKQEEQMAKMYEQRVEEIRKQTEKYQQSGEAAKEIKEMEKWLATKKITATKTGYGTFVHIDEPGTGPAVEKGKYINVKYTGKLLDSDSVFESNSFPFKIGNFPVIQGWTEGLLSFKQGGRGTLYIPGFLAYGETGGPGRKPFSPLIFDVEILQVSTEPIAPPQQPGQ
jgi:FKBP-type peptidyl-prolyl cis-trans isomerase FkpA